MNDALHDDQEREAWAAVARGVERAIGRLSPGHPEAASFFTMWSECRRAAGLSTPGPGSDDDDPDGPDSGLDGRWN